MNWFTLLTKILHPIKKIESKYQIAIIVRHMLIHIISSTTSKSNLDENNKKFAGVIINPTKNKIIITRIWIYYLVLYPHKTISVNIAAPISKTSFTHLHKIFELNYRNIHVCLCMCERDATVYIDAATWRFAREFCQAGGVRTSNPIECCVP